jgi:hypothetical protein
MHIPDLSNNCYIASGNGLRAVGWLEGSHSFESGPVSEQVVYKLQEHLMQPFVLIDFPGNHRCSLCEPSAAALGNGELIIPSEGCCYVSPSLICHYIEAHDYQPPAAFQEALLACPPQGSPSYLELLRPFIGQLTSAA